MTDINRQALFGKLNRLAYTAAQGAFSFAKLRGNPEVEIVHWIQQVVHTQDSDLHRIMMRFGMNDSRLVADLTSALNLLQAGASAPPDFSQLLMEAIKSGWVYATL